MPVKNRDDERLYGKSPLALWFAVSCVVLLVSVGLMVWKDYARPWKRYQKQFREKQIELAQDLAEQAKKTVDNTAVQAAEKKRDDIVAEVKDKNGARLTQISKRQAELQDLIKATDIDVKKNKGLLTEARYYLEQARSRLAEHPDDTEGVGAASERVNKYAAALDGAEIKISDYQTELVALQAELAQVRQPITDAEKEVQVARAESDKKRQMVEGLRQKYEKNPWRNAPVIDFIAPSLKIEQVVLPNIHDNFNFATNVKVDRCMTCHVGVDMPDFGDPTLVEKHKIPAWMQAHPALALISGTQSPHKKDVVGCSVCHAGVGWSTDFARAAHHPATTAEAARWEEEHDWHEVEFIDAPMLPVEYTEGQCFKCHKEGMYYPPHYVERLDHGWASRVEAGGRERIGVQKGPDGRALGPLETFGPYTAPAAPVPVAGPRDVVAERTKDYFRGELKTAAGDSVLPGLFKRYDDFRDPKDPKAEVQPGLDEAYKVKSFGWRAKRFDRGYDTIVAYGCQGCHKIQDFGQQVGYDGPPRVAPDLRTIADKVTEHWLERWIRAPETYRIDTPMPAFFYFVPKDRDWKPERTADGALKQVPVMDAHLADPVLAKRLDGQVNSTPRDLARLDVEILAMKQFLLKASTTNRGKNPLYDVEPPPGDVARGRHTVGTYGCAGCHVVPELEVDGTWVPDDGARFHGEMIVSDGSLRGPRLTSLGSKLKDRRWLNAWLADPRHYSADTRMPDMRWKDEKDASGNVIPAAQMRADVVDYLLSFKDPAFDQLPDTTLATEAHLQILRDMYEEFYGKGPGGTLVRKRDIEGKLGDLQDPRKLTGVLEDVGHRLMGQYGCFGCHAVAGHELDQPIGAELSRHGTKDLHQLDFGRLAHGTAHDKVPYDRWTFFRTKITWPRVWELGRVVRWNDRLRMPRFNFRMDDPAPGSVLPDAPPPATPPAPDAISTRSAVAGIILGLVDEPIKERALHHPDEYQRDIIAGRRVAKRYGCNNCHTLEGKEGTLVGWVTSDALGRSKVDPAFAPPNLFSEGARVQPGWLMKFLTRPFDLRPQAVPHMPRFGFRPEEAAALARYFDRISGDRLGIRVQPDSVIPDQAYAKPVTVKEKLPDGSERERTFVRPLDEVEALFATIGCNKCHVPKGMPGADPTEGGVAPSFDLSRERLQHDWVRTLLNDPQHLIYGTKMTKFWPMPRTFGRSVQEPFQPYLLDLRDDPEFMAAWTGSDAAKKKLAETRLAHRQMDWIADFLVHHFRQPAPAPEAPR